MLPRVISSTINGNSDPSDLRDQYLSSGGSDDSYALPSREGNVRTLIQPAAGLHVNNVPRSLGEAGLKEIFSRAGRVKRVVFYSPNFNKAAPIVFANVLMLNKEDAERVITMYDNKPPHNLKIKYDRKPMMNKRVACEFLKQNSASSSGARVDSNSIAYLSGSRESVNGDGLVHHGAHNSERLRPTVKADNHEAFGARAISNTLPHLCKRPSQVIRHSSNLSTDDDDDLMGAAASRFLDPIKITYSVAGVNGGKRVVQLMTPPSKTSLSDRFKRLRDGSEAPASRDYSDDSVEFLDDSIVSVGPVSPGRDSYSRMPPLPVKSTVCFVCQKSDAVWCSHCKKSSYCSAMCQKLDWSKHRNICTDVTVKKEQADSPVTNHNDGLLPTPPLPLLPTPPMLPIASRVNHNVAGGKMSPKQFITARKSSSSSSVNGDHQPRSGQDSGDRMRGTLASKPSSKDVPAASSQSPPHRVWNKPTSMYGAPTGNATNGARPKNRFPTSAAGDVAGSTELVNQMKSKEVVEQKVKSGGPVLTSFEQFDRDKPTQVIMVHCESPSDFYLQKNDQQGEFKKMMKQLNVSCASLSAVTKVVPGDILCCQYSDGKWYRVFVEKVEGVMADVNYVDFGNSEKIKMFNLRSLSSLPVWLTTFPRQAIRCTIEPVTEQWSSNETGVFQRFCKSNEGTLYATFVQRLLDGISVVALAQSLERAKSCKFLNLKDLASTPPLKIRSSFIESLKKGEEIRLSVTSQEKPGLIWAKSSNLANKEAEELFVGLTAHCINLPPVDPSMVGINSLVAARNTEDENWYRAVVKDQLDSGWVVRYLDLGSVDVASSVQPLPKSFWRRASLAVLLKIEPAHVDEHLSDTVTPDTVLFATVALAGSDRVQINVRLDENPMAAAFPAVATTVWRSGEGVSWQESVAALLQARNGSEAAADDDQYEELSPLTEMPKKMFLEGEKFVLVVAIDSVDVVHVHVHDVDVKSRLALLQDECNGNSALDLVSPPVTGQLVCARYCADNLWYRAVVLSLGPNGKVSLRYIDYGNVSETTVGQLKRVPPGFVAVPMTWCKVKPLMAYANVSLSVLRSALFDSEEEEEWSMTVVDGNLEVPTVTLRNSAGVLLDDLVVACMPLAPEVLVGNDQHLLSQTQSPLPPPQEVVEVAMVAEVAEAEEVLCNLDNAKYEECDVGMTLMVKVVNNTSPSSITVHRMDKEEVQPLLDLLSVNMMQYCQDDHPYEAQDSNMCIFRSEVHGSWCRGGAFSEAENGKLLVSNLDYGGSENVEIASVRKMIPVFMELPVQGVQCFLEGNLPGEAVSDEVAETMKDVMPINLQMLVEVLSKTPDGCHEIRLLD